MNHNVNYGLIKSKVQFKYSSQETDSLETRAALIETFMLCGYLPNGPKHREWLQKNIAFPEGNKLFASDLRAKLDETHADMAKFTKRWNWKWIVKDTFAESVQLQISALYQRLVSQVHMMVGQNVATWCNRNCT